MAPVRNVRPRVSYADLQRAPEDGRRYELYDGEVVVVPSPLPLHQRVLLTLEDHFRAFARAHGGECLLAPLDIVFSEYDVAQPDLVFFERSRRHLVRATAPIRDAPDIAIEVLSSSTAATDRGRKMQMFARYGVREYWIVDPGAQQIEIYWLAEGAYVLSQTARGEEILRSTVLPGFELTAAAAFVGSTD